MFLPPMGESAVDAFGEISETQYDGLATACTAFRTDLLVSSDITDLVLLHTDAGDLPDVVTSLVPGRNIVTQRRRLRT